MSTARPPATAPRGCRRAAALTQQFPPFLSTVVSRSAASEQMADRVGLFLAVTVVARHWLSPPVTSEEFA